MLSRMCVLGKREWRRKQNIEAFEYVPLPLPFMPSLVLTSIELGVEIDRCPVEAVGLHHRRNCRHTMLWSFCSTGNGATVRYYPCSSEKAHNDLPLKVLKRECVEVEYDFEARFSTVCW